MENIYTLKIKLVKANSTAFKGNIYSARLSADNTEISSFSFVAKDSEEAMQIAHERLTKAGFTEA